MKKINLLILAIIFNLQVFSQIYLDRTCDISFFSSSPVEDISAENKLAKSILNTTTNDFQVKILVKSFKFEKPLMEEHFNETYLESEEFPNAILKGKINEKIDFTKDGEHKATLTGTIEIHGVTKTRTFEGTITIKGEEIQIASTFMVLLDDHKVEVPALQKLAISEEIKVTFSSKLIPFKK